eukprot:m.164843 g.164843  ORF g.164843 m.164843 type:complete len:124 (-) comp14411_c0_seq1:101-472(-)
MDIAKDHYLDGSLKKRVAHPNHVYKLKFLMPIIFAPTVHLIRVHTRKYPKIRPYLFFGVVGAEFFRRAYLMLFDINLVSPTAQQTSADLLEASPSMRARQAALNGIKVQTPLPQGNTTTEHPS